VPVVINELIIRAVVDRNGAESQPGSSSEAGADADRDAIVAECVEQVLEILARKAER
jgi:hypothetical protein